jgi:hypothetical protein
MDLPFRLNRPRQLERNRMQIISLISNHAFRSTFFPFFIKEKKSRIMVAV